MKNFLAASNLFKDLGNFFDFYLKFFKLFFFIFTQSPPWMEFVPLWEVKGQLNSLVQEWMEIATYQKNLGSKVQSPDSSPEFGKRYVSYVYCMYSSHPHTCH